MPNRHEQWVTGRGFVLATIGAAVGLGNIWRFSYVAGENGGGAFLLIYLVSVLLVGAPIVIAEMAIGRRAAGDAVAAFERGKMRSFWRYAGWVAVVGSFLILSYYAVIAGWALKYFTGALTTALWEDAGANPGGYFSTFIANKGEPVAWQLAVLGATALVVVGGVQRGIEAVNRILMPSLAAFVVILAIYAAFLPGAGEGWRFLFMPDWAALARKEVYIAALGQAFFSLGVGMAIFITYASYMSPAMRLPISASAIVAGDTLFAIVAGLAIFPAVFAFGMDPTAGPQLAFVTLPQIFLDMPAGRIVGTAFFGLLVAAALTSMVSLLEVSVATVLHRTALRRWTAVVLVTLGVFVIGVPSGLSYGVLSDIHIGGDALLDVIDQTTSNYVLPLSGLLVAIFLGWFWSKNDAIEAAGLGQGRVAILWRWLLRYLAPFMIALIIFDSTGAL